jgi:ELWxxDGT repeat protein
MAGDTAHGNEYWVSNGTTAGTHLLKDICPGPCSGLDSFPLTSFRGRLYFQGRTSAAGSEFWITDATAQGTRLLKDACLGPCDSASVPIASAGGKLYFGAIDAEHGDQVWRTDGTTAGTRRLSDFPPFSSIDRFSGAAAGPVFVFRGYDLTHGLELWSSRGTPQTTTFLAELGTTFPGSSEPVSFYAAGSRIVFAADDGIHGSGIWASDGTEAGTIRLRPDAPPNTFHYLSAASAEHLVYFTDSVGGRISLWRTDGTPSGTFRLTPPELDIEGGSQSVVPLGDRGYFVGEDEAHGVELWTTDGTALGTHLVADLEAGPQGSRPTSLKPFLGGLRFEASLFTSGTGSWMTDGTEAGTKPFVEAFPFLEDFEPLDLETGGKALLRKALDLQHAEVWTTDGTAAGTRLVLGNLVHLGEISASGGRFLFRAGPTFEDDGTYLSDGTPGGTVRIASDLALWPTSIGLHAVAGRFVFSALGTEAGDHLTLWSTDGTPAGTAPLIETENEFEQPIDVADFVGRLLLAGGSRIWLTDGTPGGTAVLLDVSPLPFNVPFPRVAGERAYFPMFTPELGTELWAFRPD